MTASRHRSQRLSSRTRREVVQPHSVQPDRFRDASRGVRERVWVDRGAVAAVEDGRSSTGAYPQGQEALRLLDLVSRSARDGLRHYRHRTAGLAPSSVPAGRTYRRPAGSCCDRQSPPRRGRWAPRQAQELATSAPVGAASRIGSHQSVRWPRVQDAYLRGGRAPATRPPLRVAPGVPYRVRLDEPHARRVRTKPARGGRAWVHVRRDLPAFTISPKQA